MPLCLGLDYPHKAGLQLPSFHLNLACDDSNIDDENDI